MGNLRKAVDTFGGNVSDMYTVLHSDVIGGDIASFLWYCERGEWDAKKIAQAALTAGPDEEEASQGILDRLQALWSGEQYTKRFTILEHPDLRGPLSRRPELQDVWAIIQPSEPIELSVEISWEFRSKDVTTTVLNVVNDSDLVQKVVDAANFSLILDKLSDVISTEAERVRQGGSPDGIANAVDAVLHEECDLAIASAITEFYRVLNLTDSSVNWNRFKRIAKVTWAAVGTGLAVGSLVAGGAGSAAAIVAFYAVGSLGVIKSVVDTGAEIRNYFRDAGSIISECQRDLLSIESQWGPANEACNAHANLKEAGMAVLTTVFPEGIVTTASRTSDKLETAARNLDTIEVKARNLVAPLQTAMSHGNSLTDLAVELRQEAVRDGIENEPEVVEILRLITEFAGYLDEFTSIFDQIVSINSEVLPHRQTILKLTTTLTAIQDKQSTWVKLWKIALNYGMQVGSWQAGNLLDGSDLSGSMSTLSEFCSTWGDRHAAVSGLVDAINDAKEGIDSLIERKREEG